MKRLLLAMALPVLVLSAALYAADEVKLDGINCPVAGTKPAKAANAVDYKGGKVYFCCGNCPKAFEKDSAKFATKANTQLVSTGQAKQDKCPISGAPCKEDKVSTVDGAKVYFCCDMCKGKVDKADAKDKAELVFSDKAFEKANFKVAAKK